MKIDKIGFDSIVLNFFQLLVYSVKCKNFNGLLIWIIQINNERDKVFVILRVVGLRRWELNVGCMLIENRIWHFIWHVVMSTHFCSRFNRIIQGISDHSESLIVVGHLQFRVVQKLFFSHELCLTTANLLFVVGF